MISNSCISSLILYANDSEVNELIKLISPDEDISMAELILKVRLSISTGSLTAVLRQLDSISPVEDGYLLQKLDEYDEVVSRNKSINKILSQIQDRYNKSFGGQNQDEDVIAAAIISSLEKRFYRVNIDWFWRIYWRDYISRNQGDTTVEELPESLQGIEKMIMSEDKPVDIPVIDDAEEPYVIRLLESILEIDLNAWSFYFGHSRDEEREKVLISISKIAQNRPREYNDSQKQSDKEPNYKNEAEHNERINESFGKDKNISMLQKEIKNIDETLVSSELIIGRQLFEGSHYMMAKGKPQQVAHKMINSRSRSVDMMGNHKIVTDGVTLTIGGNYGVRENKIVDTILGACTSSLKSPDSKGNITISISIEELAELFNIDISAPSKRYQFIKATKGNVNIVGSMAYTIEEKDKVICYTVFSKLEADSKKMVGIINPEIVKYLQKQPLTVMPTKLLAMPEHNNDKAYSLFRGMWNYSNVDRNIERGTDDILKVGTLLSYAPFRDVNDASVKKNGWRNRIKEVLEKNLEYLVRDGYLKDWRYSYSKKEPIPDQKASFEDYETWVNTYVVFEYSDELKVDHEERIARKQKRIDAKSKKKSKTDKKKKK